MVPRVSHTTVNCENAFELSEWWKHVLEYVDLEGDPNELGDEECMIVDPTGGDRLLFIEVDDLQEPVGRVHLSPCSEATRDRDHLAEAVPPHERRAI